jgi:mRNA interferase RelE/StbE
MNRTFRITYRSTALKDLDGLHPKFAAGIVRKIGRLAGGLQGDIKRLKEHDPAYRLRMGDYRVLFDVEGDEIIIGRVKHRRDAYE